MHLDPNPVLVAQPSPLAQLIEGKTIVNAAYAAPNSREEGQLTLTLADDGGQTITVTVTPQAGTGGPGGLMAGLAFNAG